MVDMSDTDSQRFPSLVSFRDSISRKPVWNLEFLGLLDQRYIDNVGGLLVAFPAEGVVDEHRNLLDLANHLT